MTRTPTMRDLPVADAIDLWVDNTGCDPRPTVQAIPEGVLRTWSGGVNGTEVQLLTTPGGGHEVPEHVMTLIEPFLLANGR